LSPLIEGCIAGVVEEGAGMGGIAAGAGDEPGVEAGEGRAVDAPELAGELGADSSSLSALAVAALPAAPAFESVGWVSATGLDPLHAMQPKRIIRIVAVRMRVLLGSAVP
jgi:hypothetical protein